MMTWETLKKRYKYRLFGTIRKTLTSGGGYNWPSLMREATWLAFKVTNELGHRDVEELLVTEREYLSNYYGMCPSLKTEIYLVWGKSKDLINQKAWWVTPYTGEERSRLGDSVLEGLYIVGKAVINEALIEGLKANIAAVYFTPKLFR